MNGSSYINETIAQLLRQLDKGKTALYGDMAAKEQLGSPLATKIVDDKLMDPYNETIQRVIPQLEREEQTYQDQNDRWMKEFGLQTSSAKFSQDMALKQLLEGVRQFDINKTLQEKQLAGSDEDRALQRALLQAQLDKQQWEENEGVWWDLAGDIIGTGSSLALGKILK